MREAPAGSVEHDLGLRWFGSDAPPLGGRLRTRPDDFVVDEIIDMPPPSDGGSVSVARVRLVNWETNAFLRECSRRLGTPRGAIGFAGTKDKRAVTTQLFSFRVNPQRLRQGLAGLGGVEVLDAVRAARPVKLGDHRGNRFRITVRDVPHPPDDARAVVERVLADVRALGGFPNYFGLQRFGVLRPVTHRVGRHLLHGRLKEGILEYVANPFDGEEEDAYAARQALAETGDYKAAFHAYPKKLALEKAVLNHLSAHPEDLEGALRELPKNLLLMFVHAYQSWLFNRVLSARLASGLPLAGVEEGDLAAPLDPVVETETEHAFPVDPSNRDRIARLVAKGRACATGPLFGYEMRLAEGRMGALEHAALDEEGLTPASFLLRVMPELSSRGLRRVLVAPVRDLSFDVARDEVHADATKVTLAFTLPRGCYATSFARELLKNPDPRAY